MTLNDIARIRLTSQQISGLKSKTVKELVTWMGALQAQDYAMVKWAVGVRNTGSTEKLVESAIDRGEIIRTHIMRPTWHLVSAEDIYWMLELSSPHIKASLKSRHRELEITDSVLTKSNSVIVRALQGGNQLSREKIIEIFQKSGINTGDNRASHLLLSAELDGIICSGATKERRPTYALLEERVPKSDTIPRAEALAKLALRYFSSHGPATLQDFTWWSGLPVQDARNALEMIQSGIKSETIGLEIYWMKDSSPDKGKHRNSVFLLPAYDEFLISYKDRRASLSNQNSIKTVSNNGIFRPVILVNGRVAGTWKRTLKKERIIVEADLFRNHNKDVLSKLEEAVRFYGKFTGMETKHLFHIRDEH